MRITLALLVLIPSSKAKEVGPAITEVSRSYKIDPLLVAAVIEIESSFRRSTCYRGAHGLMQIQLKNRSCGKQAMLRAKYLGLYNDRQNIAAGIRRLLMWRNWCRRRNHKGHHWLLHYNQGYGMCPRGMKKCHKNQRIPITSGWIGGYADRVLRVYRRLRARHGRISTS